MKDKFVKLGFNPSNILVAPDGVDLEKFNIKESSVECRNKLNLPRDKKIIGYVGQLRTMGMDKGIVDLVEAYKILKNEFPDLIAVSVGGSQKDIDFYENILKEKGIQGNGFIFRGQRPYHEIPFYLKAFDVLVMPFPYNEHYAFYMSPLKLFEYMASGKPIVATDLPSLKGILDKDNSILVKPDNYRELADGVKFFLKNPDEAQKFAERAFEGVKNYTWQKRAGTILKFINE